MTNVLAWISLIVGLVSIVVAVFSIVISGKSEQRLLNNLQHMKEVLTKFESDVKLYEAKMDNFLTDTDRKTERIKQISSETKSDIQDAIKRVFENKFPNQDEQMQNQFLTTLFTNPDAFKSLMEMVPQIEALQKKHS